MIKSRKKFLFYFRGEWIIFSTYLQNKHWKIMHRKMKFDDELKEIRRRKSDGDDYLSL